MAERPASRRLRIFAFDPSLATHLETATINELALEVPWEEVTPGPTGEYLEVIDVDPASGVCYEPINLNDVSLLAQDGLRPSESNPQFHQQMVYGVAMRTIRHFERALGRAALWHDHRYTIGKGKALQWKKQFVRRLRIYPHALRDRNAYYSLQKKALLFGYFPVVDKDADNTPGTLVFTCLSHDIIAHETTHALLDGVHPRFNESVNPDVHAFHEAFADIVALFQHFTYPTVLESQIRRTRGNLYTESLLGQLAQQFGKSTGRGTALRDALGEVNSKTNMWELRKPNPRALETAMGPHARGAILVAAVFRAFLLIYRATTADLFRIASQGTGTLPEGDIHPDLARRLASEAAVCADRVLQMCIRAIDYCPPVDITFGDFLRGIVTADLDYSPADKNSYRLVFVESFREWGIYPRGIRSMGLDALTWPTGDELAADLLGPQETIERSTALKGSLEGFVRMQNWNLESDRYQVWKEMDRVRFACWKWLQDGDSHGREFARIFGLDLEDSTTPGTVIRHAYGPTVEIHSVRPAIRRTSDGAVRTDLVVEITQQRWGYFDRKVQEKQDKIKSSSSQRRRADFTFRAGCTVLIDPHTAEVRRVMRTPGTISDPDELNRVREFLTGSSGVVGNAFDAGLPESLSLGEGRLRREPFAFLHQLEEG